MLLRITCTVPRPLKDPIEQAVHEVFAADPADLHAYITFAADHGHAEVLVVEGSVWRAVYYAAIRGSAAEHAARLRDAVKARLERPQPLPLTPSRT
jgi:hypothetical protein